MKAQASDRGTTPVIQLAKAGFKAQGKYILKNLTWSCYPGQHWAVLGGNGAGKSTFLRLIGGDIWPCDKKESRLYHLAGKTQTGPIAFKELTRLASPELRELYHKRQWNIKVEEVIATGFFNDFRLYHKLTPDQEQKAQYFAKLLGLETLSQRGFLELSQGQAMKTLIARALVSDPKFLIMDECLTGLDQGSLDLMSLVLDQLAQKGGQIITTSHRPEELFSGITHTLTLKNGEIIQQGPWQKSKSKRTLNLSLIASNQKTSSGKAPKEPVYEITKANVAIEGKTILEDLNWTVEKGQHWALMGQNGSGKSTLLRLLLADLYPAKGGEINRFNGKNPRSIWEIREQTGFVSSDFQAKHHKKTSVIQTVLSGFYGSVGLYQAPTSEQIHAAHKWLAHFDMAEWENREINTLSYGQLRKVLLARAMVTDPLVLLLDEPMAGLDHDSCITMMRCLQNLAEKGVTIIEAVHHKDELIPAISHVGLMEKGRLIWQGPKKDLQN